MRMLLLTVGVALVTVSCGTPIHSVHKDNVCSRYSDGCSTYGMYEDNKEILTKACNRHDACYHCVSMHTQYKAEMGQLPNVRNRLRSPLLIDF